MWKNPIMKWYLNKRGQAPHSQPLSSTQPWIIAPSPSNHCSSLTAILTALSGKSLFSRQPAVIAFWWCPCSSFMNKSWPSKAKKAINNPDCFLQESVLQNHLWHERWCKCQGCGPHDTLIHTLRVIAWNRYTLERHPNPCLNNSNFPSSGNLEACKKFHRLMSDSEVFLSCQSSISVRSWHHQIKGCSSGQG